MIRKYLLPFLALLGVAFAVMTVVRGNKPPPVTPAVAEPSRAPYKHYVAGAGIVETGTENIPVGTLVPGVVKEIYVKVGDRVRAGDRLWLIDDRDLRADLRVKQADALTKRAAVKGKASALLAAQSQLAKLKAQPRPEDVPPAEAAVAGDAASLSDLEAQLKRMQGVAASNAISQDDLDRREHAVEVQRAKLAESTANLALLKAGAWKPDVDIAAANVQTAQADHDAASADADAADAQVDASKELLSRLLVRAPVGGQLLQVKIHLGEYAQAGVLETPLMLLGDVETLVIRTDVDENDAWRIRPGSPATAFLRGKSDDQGVPLTFYRIEPYVVPKKSLTGDSAERVDTRVLQVLYQFDRGERPIYVGQQMDVYIEAPPIHPDADGAPATPATEPSTRS